MDGGHLYEILTSASKRSSSIYSLKSTKDPHPHRKEAVLYLLLEAISAFWIILHPIFDWGEDVRFFQDVLDAVFDPMENFLSMAVSLTVVIKTYQEIVRIISSSENTHTRNYITNITISRFVLTVVYRLFPVVMMTVILNSYDYCADQNFFAPCNETWSKLLTTTYIALSGAAFYMAGVFVNFMYVAYRESIISDVSVALRMAMTTIIFFKDNDLVLKIYLITFGVVYTVLFIYVLLFLPHYVQRINIVRAAVYAGVATGAFIQVARVHGIALGDMYGVLSLVVLVPTAIGVGAAFAWVSHAAASKVFKEICGDPKRVNEMYLWRARVVLRMWTSATTNHALQNLSIAYGETARVSSVIGLRTDHLFLIICGLQDYRGSLYKLNKFEFIKSSVTFYQSYGLFLSRHLRSRWLAIRIGESSEEFVHALQHASGLYEKCLSRMLEFWEQLLGSDPDVDQLPAIVKSIRHLEQSCDDAFLSLIRDYPNASQVLVRYAAFLENVKHNHALSSLCLDVAAQDGSRDERRLKQARASDDGTLKLPNVVDDEVDTQKYTQSDHGRSIQESGVQYTAGMLTYTSSSMSTTRNQANAIEARASHVANVQKMQTAISRKLWMRILLAAFVIFAVFVISAYASISFFNSSAERVEYVFDAGTTLTYSQYLPIKLAVHYNYLDDDFYTMATNNATRVFMMEQFGDLNGFFGDLWEAHLNVHSINVDTLPNYLQDVYKTTYPVDEVVLDEVCGEIGTARHQMSGWLIGSTIRNIGWNLATNWWDNLDLEKEQVNSKLRYITEHGVGVLWDYYVSLTKGWLRYQNEEHNNQMITMLVVMAVCLAVIVVMEFALFWPVLSSVTRKRLDMLKLLQLIPQEDVSALVKQCNSRIDALYQQTQEEPDATNEANGGSGSTSSYENGKYTPRRRRNAYKDRTRGFRNKYMIAPRERLGLALLALVLIGYNVGGLYLHNQMASKFSASVGIGLLRGYNSRVLLYGYARAEPSCALKFANDSLLLDSGNHAINDLSTVLHALISGAHVDDVDDTIHAIAGYDNEIDNVLLKTQCEAPRKETACGEMTNSKFDHVGMTDINDRIPWLEAQEDIELCKVKKGELVSTRFSYRGLAEIFQQFIFNATTLLLSDDVNTLDRKDNHTLFESMFICTILDMAEGLDRLYSRQDVVVKDGYNFNISYHVTMLAVNIVILLAVWLVCCIVIVRLFCSFSTPWSHN